MMGPIAIKAKFKKPDVIVGNWNYTRRQPRTYTRAELGRCAKCGADHASEELHGRLLCESCYECAGEAYEERKQR